MSRQEPFPAGIIGVSLGRSNQLPLDILFIQSFIILFGQSGYSFDEIGLGESISDAIVLVLGREFYF
jgi:hypothetical protein